MSEINILDVSKVQGKKIKLSDYTHIFAYHACREENKQIFFNEGLRPFTKEKALATAIRKLESQYIDKKKIEEKCLEKRWRD